ncbi:MAG: hypothetical protein HQL17_07025 [Candidatus Omnitrophica bacterium]|nr:hypothetical protein [Candidatus Omnitrophota bacterium]
MTRCKVFFLAVLFLFSAPSWCHALPYGPGEKIRYVIKQSAFKVGEATLEFQGETYRDGKKYTLIIFTSKGFNFYDEERIFVDGATLLPQRVIRDLNIFGKKEQIMEDYDQATGTIRVTKLADGVSSEQLLKKEGPIDNIYAFLYRFRGQTAFKAETTFDLKLPTLDVTIAHVKSVPFNAAGKTYQSSLIRSVPSKYSIWMDEGPQHLPLRIAGAVGISNTVMTMIEYQEAPKK